MDTRTNTVADLERLVYRHHWRVVGLALEGKAAWPAPSRRVRLRTILAVIASRVREARGEFPAPAGVRAG